MVAKIVLLGTRNINALQDSSGKERRKYDENKL